MIASVYRNSNPKMIRIPARTMILRTNSLYKNFRLKISGSRKEVNSVEADMQTTAIEMLI